MVDAGLIEMFFSVEFLLGALMYAAGEQGVKKVMRLRSGDFLDNENQQQQSYSYQYPRHEQPAENEWAVESRVNEQPSEPQQQSQQSSATEDEPTSGATREVEDETSSSTRNESYMTREEPRGPQEYDEYQAGPRR